MQTPVCLATRQAAARLIIRTGRAPASGHPYFPLLVVDECDFQPVHGHVHTMLTPGPWIRRAPCCQEPYVIHLATP